MLVAINPYYDLPIYGKLSIKRFRIWVAPKLYNSIPTTVAQLKTVFILVLLVLVGLGGPVSDTQEVLIALGYQIVPPTS